MQQKWRRSGEMKDRMKLSLPQKLMVFLMLLILRFCWFILNLTLFYDQTQGSDAVFSILYTDNAIYRLTLEMTGLVISSFNMSVRRWISR